MASNPYLNSLEVRVLSATRLELVVILYDAAIEAVQRARRNLASGDIMPRSRAVGKALSILIELSRSLNPEAGDLSHRLRGVYDFMQKSLLDANFHQTDDGFEVVERLLLSIREAWAKIATPQSSEATPAGQPSDVSMPPAFVCAEPPAMARLWSA